MNTICFFLAYEDSPYSGTVRPFVNWYKELRKMDKHEIEFVLLNVGEKIVRELSNLNAKFYLFYNKKKLYNFLKERKYDSIIIDDYIKRLRILEKIDVRIKKIVYVQVLYGLHNIFPIFNSKLTNEKIFFSMSKLVPFDIIRRIYERILKISDIILVNSEITGTLLYLLYGIEYDDIVYPPVDRNIFRNKKIEKSDASLLYLGSRCGDTNEFILRKITEILNKRRYEILTIGNKFVGTKMKKRYNVKYLEDITDEELAKVYSRCRITICPQNFELFGYVVAESISCGTPVMAFNRLGPKEIIEKTGGGFLAKNYNEMLGILENTKFENTNMKKIYKKRLFFDSLYSTKKILKVIEEC